MLTKFGFDLQTHSEVIVSTDRQEDRQTDRQKIKNAITELQLMYKRCPQILILICKLIQKLL